MVKLQRARTEPEKLWADRAEPLPAALRDMVRHPVRNLLAAWNWKTGAASAVLRAGVFFYTNRHSGSVSASRAVVVEALFAIVSAGLLGAAVQRLRAAEPVWGTALLICFGLPAAILPAQWVVHRLAGTPHVWAGLVISLFYASLASALTWLLQRQGYLLVRAYPGPPKRLKPL